MAQRNTQQRQDTERAGKAMQANPTRQDDPASEQRPTMTLPKQGDTYRCNGCGMELEITGDCRCTHPEAVHLQCCGAEMTVVR